MPEAYNTVYFNSAKQLCSSRYNDTYATTAGAEAESEHVFIHGNNLPGRFKEAQTFTIAELGFGTGLNLLKTLQFWSNESAPESRLEYIGFEALPLPPALLQQVHQNYPDLKPYSDLFFKEYTATPQSDIELQLNSCNTSIRLIIGDVNARIPQLRQQVDAWYLDGFAPAKNPQMWSTIIFNSMATCSIPQITTCATYSCARAVREGLSQVGFTVDKTPGFGKKRYMLRGQFS